MKQRITPEQLNELSDKGKEKLREWWRPVRGDVTYIERIVYGEDQKEKELISALNPSSEFTKGMLRDDTYPLLNIGQMIELLQDKASSYMGIMDWNGNWYLGLVNEFEEKKSAEDDLFLKVDGTYAEHTMWPGGHHEIELVDALWQACKEVLEKER